MIPQLSKSIAVELCASSEIRNSFGHLRASRGHGIGMLDALPSTSSVFYVDSTVSGSGRRRYALQVLGRTPPFHCLYLGDLLSSRMGYKDGDRLTLSAVSIQQAPCASAELHPLSVGDWKLLETSVSHIEDVLLSQIRLVHTNLPLVLFISSSVAIHLRVGNTSPRSDMDPLHPTPLLLSPDTVVSVAPPPMLQSNHADLSEEHPSTFNHNTGPDDLEIVNAKGAFGVTLLSSHLSRDRNMNSDTLFRIVPNCLLAWKEDGVGTMANSFNFVVAGTGPSTHHHFPPHMVMVESTLTHVSAPAILLNTSPVLLARFPRLEKLASALANLDTVHAIPHCWLSPNLLTILSDREVVDDSLECSRVSIAPASLSTAKSIKPCSSFIAIRPPKASIPTRWNAELLERLIEGAVIAGAELGTPLIFSQPLQLAPPCGGTLLATPVKDFPSRGEGVVYDYIPCGSKVSISANDGEEMGEAEELPTHDISNVLSSKAALPLTHSASLLKIRYQEEIVGDLCRLILASVKIQPQGRSAASLLLGGADGTGKTTVLQLLANELYNRYAIPCVLLDCRSESKGKPIHTILRDLKNTLARLDRRFPSALLLDNIDSLLYGSTTRTGGVVPDEEGGDEEEARRAAITQSKLRDSLHDSCREVIVLASISTPPNTTESQMAEDFPHQFRIGKVPLDEELHILKRLIANRDDQHYAALAECGRKEDSKTSGVKRRGYTVGELVKIAECARLAPNWREGEVPSTAALRQQILDWEKISATTTADCRRRIGFSDIGALPGVKRQLTEVFVWASKFSALYASCGVRVGRNAILHGPSGCGKTMLLHAVAGETGMNTIFVKGPELLSKYIGESEENVRSVFRRARDSSSTATLLIFDEFDALVPARGHDSTGVTDRVVNQFLTELDGIGDGQTSKGGEADVYVIAATNRLHAIDRALLRAGRFDHKFLVAHPASVDERLEILRLRANDVHVSSHVDWVEIAEATAGWTGAQLEALIVNANFLAAREHRETGGEAGANITVIEGRHLREVVRQERQTSRPRSHVSAPLASRTLA